jgi:hypothetical protein
VSQGKGPEFKPQYYKKRKKERLARCQWLTPIILAIQEAEVRRIIIQETISQKYKI